MTTVTCAGQVADQLRPKVPKLAAHSGCRQIKNFLHRARLQSDPVARQKPGSPGEVNHTGGRAWRASPRSRQQSTPHPLTPRQPLSTKLSGYRHGWLPTAAP